MRSSRIVLAVVAMLILPAASFASDARLDALAVQREYMEDYINFRTFPTVAARYANLVTAGLGFRDTEANTFDEAYQVGAIGSGNPEAYGVFALYLNNVRNTVGGVSVGQAQVDLTWAKQFEGVDIGASVLWTSSSFEDNELRNRTAPQLRGLGDPFTNQFALTGGVKINSSDASFIEGAAQLGWLSWEETQGGVIVDQDGGNVSYRLTARMVSEMSSTTTLVPLILLSHTDVTPDQDLTPTPDDLFTNEFNVGVAVHHEVNGDDLLVFGIAANYLKTQFTDTGNTVREDSQWDLPALFMALEFDLYNWLTARVGATKTIAMVSNDNPDLPLDQDFLQSDFVFGLGAGFHFDHFDLDATINPQSVFTGGYLFSGESTEPFTRITGTYYW
jgi:hypothetical protein